ncbi:hypothetical protein THASP1DRAFT_24898 [Thamnocephalis sphaerospora]|uniref:F-box domain-containing protein n=1 Tax=Thamnocephalis sphaerospora TaxID=78915 RepID=A0A4P9XLU6_9FUNG|nr:hypothetical protein THASP1DRAFT_24898 [Thamnocephalis sphaerospora]|eukprot:RKP06854.1 hypothetical protein THASP1DRAFT_24898 [Thamnocephalis sphaerospora]
MAYLRRVLRAGHAVARVYIKGRNPVFYKGCSSVTAVLSAAMTSKQLNVKMTTVTLAQLPLKILLLIVQHADARTALCLCTTARVFWNTLGNTQNLWQQLYRANFPESAAEQFWLTAYRTRLADDTKADLERVIINWRHALSARMQTERNWRIGRSVRRSYLQRGHQCIAHDWIHLGFTPCEVLLKSRVDRMMYAMSATPTRATPAPSPILMLGAFSREQTGAYIHAVSDHGILLKTNAAESGPCGWVRQLTSDPAVRLPRSGTLVDERGRWVLAWQAAQSDDIAARWMLLDLKEEFLPCHLTALDIFDHDDYAIDPLSAGEEDVAQDLSSCQGYSSACIVERNSNRITICAANASRTKLYWKIIEVAPNCNGNANASAKSRALSGGFVYVRACNDYRFPTVTITFVINTRCISGAIQLPKSATGAHDDLRTFEHGWADGAQQRLLMQLPHRQLIVTMCYNLQRPHASERRIRLLRLGDGTVAKSYLLPASSSLTHVLGDLALLGTRHCDGFGLLLFDVFAGTAVRVLHDAATSPHVDASIVSPLHLFDNWSQMASQSDSDSEGSEYSMSSQNSRKSPSSLPIQWLDFMPSDMC